MNPASIPAAMPDSAPSTIQMVDDGGGQMDTATARRLAVSVRTVTYRLTRMS